MQKRKHGFLFSTFPNYASPWEMARHLCNAESFPVRRGSFLSTVLIFLFYASTASAIDLMEIYTRATDSDPVYKQSIATYQATIEARPQAMSQLLPLIRVEGNGDHHSQDITTGRRTTNGVAFESHGYSLDISQPLFRFDRFLALDVADSQILQAQADMDAAHQDLMERVAENYFNALAADDDLAFARAEKTALERQLEQSKQLFEVGMSALTDAQEAQAGYDRAVANEILAINAVDNSREALREITGDFFSSLSALGETIPLVTPNPDNIDEWVKTSQQQNLHVISAQHSLENARQTIKVQKAGHLPTIDIVATRDYDSALGIGGTTQLHDMSVSLELNMFLFQGGLVDSRIRQSEQLYNRAFEQLEQQFRAAQRQTRESYLGVISGVSNVTALKQAVISSETALEATQAGYEAGTRTAVDVVTAQRTTSQTRRDYARARYDYLLNTLRLKQAAGTLAPEDLAQINSWMQ